MMTTTLLTAEEECELARRRDAGDREAWRELVARNRGLVFDWVNSHVRASQPADREDAEQEGMLGLMTFAAKFAPARNCRFSTGAGPWIRQAVDRARHVGGSLIRVPVHVHEAIAGGAGRRGKGTPDALKDAGRLALRASAPGSDDPAPGRRPRDDWGSSRIPSPPDAILAAERRALVERAIGKLYPFEREVIRRRFPLDGGEPEPLKAIGRDMKVSGERTRQIEVQALARLRALLGEDAV